MEIPSKGAVVVKFYSKTCPPCAALKPKIEELKNETEGVDFLDVDINEERKLAEKYNISGVPAVLFIRDGKVEAQIFGNQFKQIYQEEINLLLE